MGEKHDVARAQDTDHGSCILVMDSILCAFLCHQGGDCVGARCLHN